jgi:hypothetical protein
MGLYPFTLPSCCRLFTSWSNVMGYRPMRYVRGAPELAAVGLYNTFIRQGLAPTATQQQQQHHTTCVPIYLSEITTSHLCLPLVIPNLVSISHDIYQVCKFARWNARLTQVGTK